MAGKVKKFLKKLHIKRTTVLLCIFLGMSFILINKLFKLQIIQGQDYADKFSVRTTKTRYIKSTRGNIFDRNGELLASNKLSYTLTIEDNGTYDSNREKNLALNGIAYKILTILNQYGDKLDQTFHVVLNQNGEYEYDIQEGTTLNRFRADIYGRALIEDMEPAEASSTAPEMMEYLTGSERFCITEVSGDPYSKEELDKAGIPQKLSPEETLQVAIIRYALSTNSFKKYMPVTIARDLSDESVAAIMENKDILQGIEVVEDSVRYYEDSIYFANIIGYTGKPSTEELEELQEKDSSKYSSTSIVGKTGIEQFMETELQGTDGSEQVNVDNLGKVLKIDEDTRIDPVTGHDVYLTIDKKKQEAYYKILEQKIAGILLGHITNAKTFDKKATTDSSQILVPIYDVYNALVANSVIDIDKFSRTDASDTEKILYDKFQQKQSQVFGRITEELTGDAPAAYKDLDEEMQEYLDYLVDDLLTEKLQILSSNAIDKSDSTYLAWTKEGTISLQQYLTYAASQNWIDIAKISPKGEYLDSKEVYQSLAKYLEDYLLTDTAFSKLLYKYMLLQDMISGEQLCVCLYEQGVLPKKDDGIYEGLLSGQYSAYNFMLLKLSTLEITPGQLALDPCSGSIVETDPNTGQVLACVTYPGYDNNRLANTMDTEYYNKLYYDLSEPFYNKATQQRTAPGSTFKLASAIVGMKEGYVDDNTYIECKGSFDLVNPPINCWNKQGHGVLGITSAIEQSCNVYFLTIGYEMGKKENGEFSESLSLQKLSTYASMMDLDKKTGIEIAEASPQVSDSMAVPSYMGQGTHLYTTSELARYASLLANSGTSYKLTLLLKTTDSQGNLLKEYQPDISGQLELSQDMWNDIHNGMERVVATHSEFDSLGMAVAGKTGTAQQDKYRPDHGLFIGYAPAENPETAIAVRIPFGYSSGNACLVANDVFKYAYNLADEKTLVTGTASTNLSNTSND